MTVRVASLHVAAPDGRAWTVEIGAERFTIGRATPGSNPDLALDPDPQRWVGRLHCSVENPEGMWWLVDNATVNGTSLCRSGAEDRVIGRRRLHAGDTIRILGDVVDDRAVYWELAFQDPHSTAAAPVDLSARPDPVAGVCLDYDWIQARVSRRENGTRTEVTGLRPQAHRLIRYMAEVSRTNGGMSVACSYAELIRALWGEPEEWAPHRTYTAEDVRDVVSDVRRCIETDPARPRLLETMRGFGYRLVLCPPTPLATQAPGPGPDA